MPTVGTGRIDPGTGDVSFNGPDTPPVPGLSPRSAATFSDVRSIAGNNLGGGAGIFSGVNGATDVVLDFKSIVAGSGIAVLVDANSITIRATGSGGGGGGGASAFVDLTDGPGAIAPRGILVGNANGDAIGFIPSPTVADSVLSWGGSSFIWTSVAPGVSSVAMAASGPLSVIGSPITSNGTFVLSMQTSGVTAGTYNRVVVDQFGRVTSADNVPSGVSSVQMEAVSPVVVQGSPITSDGTFVVSLASSGVAAGTYNQVTVDQFGRVTVGENVSYSVPETDTLQTVTERGNATDQTMRLLSSQESTGPNTGALVVSGGVGIGDDLFVGGDLTVLGVLNASISGSAESADRLAQPRDIALAGAVVGQGLFDGSTDLVITTDLSATGVTPGTYTRVSVEADGRIVFGANLVPEDLQPLITSLTFTDLTVSGNLTVGGDALVGGNFTSVNTANLTVDDTYILLGGATPPASNDGRDRGVAFRWHDGTDAQLGFFGFRRSNGRLTFQQGVPESALTGGIFTGTLGSIEANITGSADTALRLATPRTINLAGAVTGAITTDFSSNVTLNAIFGPVGSGVGTFSRVVVDSNGRIVSGSNPAPANSTINLIGDVTGVGTNTITVTLANVGTEGTYTRVITDAKGRVVGGSNPPPQSLSLSGDVSGSGAGTVSVTLATVATPGTFTQVVIDAKGRVLSGANPPAPSQSIIIAGDVTGSGTAGTTTTLLLTTTGVVAGTYDRVVVDSRGRVTSGSNPAVSTTITLAGDATGVGTLGSSLVVALANTGVTAGTFSTVVVDAKGRVTGGSSTADTLADVTSRGATTSSNLTLSGTVNITSTTASTSSTTGALRVAGGVGLAGDVNTAATSSVNLGIGNGVPIGARLWVTGNYGANILAVSWASSITLNFSTANNFAVTLTGTTNIANPSNVIVGQSGVIYLTQDATGNRVVSFGTHWRFPSGTAPANTTTANAVDIVVYTVRANGAISAVLIPNV